MRYLLHSRQLERVRPGGNPPRWYHWVGFLPVYVITKIYLPFFRADHPWKKETLSLYSWVYRGTDLAFQFSLTFWVCFLSMAFLFSTLFWF